MDKKNPGRNDPCLCGSGKKYKKCCINKKPRKQTIVVGSFERLKGFDYDKEKMAITGLTHDDRLINPTITYSQSQYNSISGKEKVIARIHDKVITNQADLIRHLSSSFDLIIAADTNTKVIENETISVTGIIHCVVQNMDEPNKFYVDFPLYGAIPFRNCPKELPPEKYGWIMIIKEIYNNDSNKFKRFAIVTDHDSTNHYSYNNNEMPIFRDINLPDNFNLLYGRGDSSSDTLLNYLVKKCDKKSTEVLKEIERNHYYQHRDRKLSITQIPVPTL